MEIVSAADQDMGINNLISYSIIDTTDHAGMAVTDMFMIDSGSGVIYTSAVLDHEATNEYTIVVEVSDD